MEPLTTGTSTTWNWSGFLAGVPNTKVEAKIDEILTILASLEGVVARDVLDAIVDRLVAIGEDAKLAQVKPATRPAQPVPMPTYPRPVDHQPWRPLDPSPYQPFWLGDRPRIICETSFSAN